MSKITNHWSAWLTVGCFLLMACLISVAGEFPLNDDWVYSWSVKHLVETGEFKILGSVAASVVPILAASIPAKIFGCSYLVLRLVSLPFGLLGYLGLYLALCELGVKKRDAGFLSAIFLFNPLIVNLCFGFMTDMPAIALNNWFFYFSLLALKNGRLKFWLLAAAALMLSLYSRQTVLVFMPATVLLVALSFFIRRQFIAPVITLLVLPLTLSFIVEPLLLAASRDKVGYIGYKNIFAEEIGNLLSIPGYALPLLLEQFDRMLAYLGLFLLPLLPAGLAAAFLCFRKYKLSFMVSLIGAAFFVALPLSNLIFAQQKLMPFSENLFAPPRVGAYSIISGAVPTWGTGPKFWLSLVALSAAFLTGSFLIFAAIKSYAYLRSAFIEKRFVFSWSKKIETGDPLVYAPAFFVIALIFALAFLTIQTRVLNLDRYYLLALGPAILLGGCFWKYVQERSLWLFVIPGLLMFLIFSSLSTQDYMNFSRARWAAIYWLEGQGVQSRRIDGGPEYNCSRHAELGKGFRINESFIGWTFDYRGGFPRNRWRWWPIVSEEYIVAGSPLEGYDVVRTFKYWSPLKWRQRELFALVAKKQP